MALLEARRGPITSVYMLLLALGLFAFWSAPAGAPGLCAPALGVCGFLVYGPLMEAASLSSSPRPC